ncbi:MAG: nuclear transport factor 2 family protein [Burkholderiales bacterium]|nr:nuclear transport factor 2 family protein [Burkholderiales bacterium]
MPTLPDAASIVQRQLDAYNARDIDGLMATYSPDIEYYEFPGTLLAAGAEAVRARQSVRLQEPDLYARLLGRTVMGNLVMDHEMVTRNFPEGIGTVELIAIYEVQGEHIARGWFKFGEKRMGAPE